MGNCGSVVELMQIRVFCYMTSNHHHLLQALNFLND